MRQRHDCHMQAERPEHAPTLSISRGGHYMASLCLLSISDLSVLRCSCTRSYALHASSFSPSREDMHSAAAPQSQRASAWRAPTGKPRSLLSAAAFHLSLHKLLFSLFSVFLFCPDYVAAVPSRCFDDCVLAGRLTDTFPPQSMRQQMRPMVSGTIL